MQFSIRNGNRNAWIFSAHATYTGQRDSSQFTAMFARFRDAHVLETFWQIVETL